MNQIEISVGEVASRFFPLKILIWVENAEKYKEISLTDLDMKNYISIKEIGLNINSSVPEKIFVQCISRANSYAGTPLDTWHGICCVEIERRKSIHKSENDHATNINLTSAAKPFPRNGIMLFYNNMYSFSQIDVDPDKFSRSNDDISIQNKVENNRYRKYFKPIDPANPTAIDAENSEFHDIFFDQLNNLDIPVCHILLSPVRCIHFVDMLKRLVLITNSHLFTSIEDGILHTVSENKHIQEGEYLSYMLVYLVNFCTYCEDFNLGNQRSSPAEKIRPNIQLTGSGDCEDFALYVYFFYRTLLQFDLTLETEELKMLQKIARRYIPFVQLGAVTAPRMLNTQTPMHSGSDFDAHCYVQLMPATFVQKNFVTDDKKDHFLILDARYNFCTDEFDPPLDHLIVEGTNISKTTEVISFNILKNANLILNIGNNNLVGKCKGIQKRRDSFYEYVIVGLTDMITAVKNETLEELKPLQFIFKRKNTRFNYGMTFKESLKTQNSIFGIYPATLFTKKQLSVSKTILQTELPIFIDGSVDQNLTTSVLDIWKRMFTEAGIDISLTCNKNCNYEVLFPIHESVDYSVCRRVCNQLTKLENVKTCIRIEIVGKNLWGISLGIS